MKLNLLSSVIILFYSSAFCAQDFNQEKLDQYFDTIAVNNQFMGSVAVAQKGEIIYTRSLGFLEDENKTKANKNTKYRIGSITKTFTAVLVLKAIEEKKLKLNQTIETYFPSIENADEITLKQLLQHRSGIHNFTNDEDYLSYHTQHKTPLEMLTIITEKGSDFEPGSKAAYSNANYVLLTLILEKVYNQSYGELLKKYITQPIGLNNTLVGTKIITENNEAKSFQRLNDWKVEAETDMSIPLGAGSIVSTPSDLVKFSDALFDHQLVSEKSLLLMKTIKDNYGIGLLQIPFHNKTGYGHTGGIDGFSSIFTHFADGDISFAMISNGSGMNNNDISIAVLSAVYNKPFELPVFETYEVSAADLDPYLGVYSSSNFPLKVTITKDNNVLIAQATGQPSFPLEATDKNRFEFDR